MKYYHKDRDAIVWLGHQATASYWDDNWKKNIKDYEKYIRNYNNDYFFIPALLKHMPKGSYVLEGGCGTGHLVSAISKHGYKVSGIDYAENTVERVNEIAGELDIRKGDVRSLEFDDESIDAHVSGGVIEHFIDGYDGILQEMYRTLKPGGKAFISFPYINLIRYIKLKKGHYPHLTEEDLQKQKDTFYQFAFRRKSVEETVRQIGFSCVDVYYTGAFKGIKDEVALLTPFLQPMFNSRNLMIRCFKKAIDLSFIKLSSHMMMLVFQKEDI